MRVCLNVSVVAVGSQWVAYPESASMVFVNLTLPPLPCEKNQSLNRAMCVSPIFTSCHLWVLGTCEKVWGKTDSNQNQKCTCSDYPYKQLK